MGSTETLVELTAIAKAFLAIRALRDACEADNEPDTVFAAGTALAELRCRFCDLAAAV